MDTLPHVPFVEPAAPARATVIALAELRERILLHLHQAGGVSTRAELAAVAEGADLSRALDWFWFKAKRWTNGVAITDAGKLAAVELGF